MHKIDALIKAKYTELGRTMYGMVKNDSSDADRIAQAVMEIDHLYKKMAQCNARIELMKKIVTCPVCGTKNRFSNTYCTACMHKLVSTDEEPEDYAFNPDDAENR